MKKIILYITICLTATTLFGQKINFEKPEKVEKINSEAEESLPLYDNFNQVLYLVRTMHEENTGGKKSGNEIWAFDERENQQFKASTFDFSNLNNEKSNAVVGIAENGLKLYLLNVYDPEFGMIPGVSSSSLKDGVWSSPRSVTLKGLDANTKIYNVYVHPSEEIMLLSIRNTTPDSSYAIFMSEKIAGGWSIPIPLNDLNEDNSNQITPYLSPDKKTLYFSSDRSGGQGDFDIYMAEMGTGMDNWKNIKPIEKLNSSSFDAYFSIADANSAYFSSNRDGGLADIYESQLIIEFKDTVKATEIDYKNEIVESKFPNVNFAFDSYKLNLSAHEFLDDIVDSLNSNQKWDINLEGHTDHIGTNSYNQVLSKNRAMSVKDYLLSKGISEKRISIEYYGENRPTATNETDYGRFQNRRVEISFKK